MKKNIEEEIQKLRKIEENQILEEIINFKLSLTPELLNKFNKINNIITKYYSLINIKELNEYVQYTYIMKNRRYVTYEIVEIIEHFNTNHGNPKIITLNINNYQELIWRYPVKQMINSYMNNCIINYSLTMDINQIIIEG